MTFAQLIAEWMKSHHLSVTAATWRLKCSGPTIRNWISGRTTPYPKQVGEIADKLGIDIKVVAKSIATTTVEGI